MTVKTIIDRRRFTAGGADQALEDYINKTRRLYHNRKVISVQEVSKLYLTADDLRSDNPSSVEFLIVWEQV